MAAADCRKAPDEDAEGVDEVEESRLLREDLTELVAGAPAAWGNGGGGGVIVTSGPPNGVPCELRGVPANAPPSFISSSSSPSSSPGVNGMLEMGEAAAPAEARAPPIPAAAPPLPLPAAVGAAGVAQARSAHVPGRATADSRRPEPREDEDAEGGGGGGMRAATAGGSRSGGGGIDLEGAAGSGEAVREGEAMPEDAIPPPSPSSLPSAPPFRSGRGRLEARIERRPPPAFPPPPLLPPPAAPDGPDVLSRRPRCSGGGKGPPPPPPLAHGGIIARDVR